MLSCQQSQNVIDGKKRVILNPSEQQKKDFETATFAENEVYGIDILVSTGEDGKVRLSVASCFAIVFDHLYFRHESKNRRQPSTREIRMLPTS